jgi:hypothetical protein
MTLPGERIPAAELTPLWRDASLRDLLCVENCNLTQWT